MILDGNMRWLLDNLECMNIPLLVGIAFVGGGARIIGVFVNRCKKVRVAFMEIK